MDAKCSKCEGIEFSIKKREDKVYCYVVCKSCGTINGVLEDIDFNKSHDNVIKNHNFFKKRFNDLEEQMKEMEKREKEMFELIQLITSKIK
jgi:hypothetical protein